MIAAQKGMCMLVDIPMLCARLVRHEAHCRRWPPVEQFLGRTTLQHLFRWIENSRRIQASDSTSTKFDICCVALQTQQEVSSKASSTSSCKGEAPALCRTPAMPFQRSMQRDRNTRNDSRALASHPRESRLVHLTTATH